MDLDIIRSTKEGEIAQFLCDVRDYFKAALATSEYENTSNMFYLTASESTEQLLNRCECLLNRLSNKGQKLTINNSDFLHLNQQKYNNEKAKENYSQILNSLPGNLNQMEHKDASYLDMSAFLYNNNKSVRKTAVCKTIDENSADDRDDASFRCSTLVVRQNKSFLHRIQESMITSDNETDAEQDGECQEDKTINYKDDSQIYDICQVTTQGSDGEEDEVGLAESQKAITIDSYISLANIDCPYIDLPAGHLAINKSTKYGQLLRVERRLFFDQSKKFYCGILNDWLLCYADGPTSNSPTISLYLKLPNTEIEHFGEGKRRDICFQITTSDTNKKFVFQAINEIDAKEWIHAIEASIRCGITSLEVRNSSSRKLPTPPIVKKLTFVSSFEKNSKMVSNSTLSNDGIYEEPSSSHEYLTTPNSEIRPELPYKQNNHLTFAHKYQYDIPKCPPQPLKHTRDNDVLLINPYDNKNANNTSNKINTEHNNLPSSLIVPLSSQKMSLKLEENLDFQAKVKDVHCKLTSQLSAGPYFKKSFQKILLPQNETESPDNANSILPSITSNLSMAVEMKKQNKLATTPPISPQKVQNEKSSFAKNWFLNRRNKSTSSTRSNPSLTPSNSPSKCKQSEKENLLNCSTDLCDGPVPTILKSSPNSGTSKVNMIINQLEASGHFASMFTADNIASFNSLCDNDCNNYEPIMTVSTSPKNLTKKV